MTHRLAIAGGPRTGKTQLARKLAAHLGCALRCTDDLIPLGWSNDSAVAATWFDDPNGFVIEGVAVVRALRKWLASHAEGKPCDRVVWLDIPKVQLTREQLVMAKGCETIWRGVRPLLLERGVEITVESEEAAVQQEVA